MNDCEFHEICDKCGNPEVKGLKNFPKGANNPKPTKEQFLGYSPENLVIEEKEEPIETFEQVYEIDGISPRNTLFVIEKLFLSKGWSLQSSAEAKELLRPLIIYLDRHKENCEKEHFKKGVEFGKGLTRNND